MNKITLSHKASDGKLLQVVFIPEIGMNMVSYKKDNLEIIDQSTLPLFEERSAGLGALIGPHFHRRNPDILPIIEDESLFPHIAKIKAKGVLDPFSHGIARYAPWKVTHFSENKLTAVLSGKDEWKGVALSKLEGQNFKMTFDAALHPEGLKIKLTITSDTDSVIGLHYYYQLPQGTAFVKSDISQYYIEKGEIKSFPTDWPVDAKGHLFFDLSKEADFGFHPLNKCKGIIVLETELYRLKTEYTSPSEENSWQLYHPKGASYVCIEPLSASIPLKPCLTASTLDILLEIQDIY